ncbi:hypothetical protein AVEN_15896-1 [Araneus ventricosus]|uniref:Uncharacterized protein n=1 Tax=Araneus ventricosus TaxID=182803 RepID=A0A4Y2S1E3_ARAVE|nr:hypothetical protein AVEN_15896-1 [Araneus ventricosus]
MRAKIVVPEISKNVYRLFTAGVAPVRGREAAMSGMLPAGKIFVPSRRTFRCELVVSLLSIRPTPPPNLTPLREDHTRSATLRYFRKTTLLQTLTPLLGKIDTRSCKPNPLRGMSHRSSKQRHWEMTPRQIPLHSRKLDRRQNSNDFGRSTPDRQT